MKQIWDELRGILKERLSAESFRVWISPLSFCRSDNETIILTCPNQFYASWIQEQYLPLLADYMNINGVKWEIRLQPEEKVREGARHQLNLPRFSPSELKRPAFRSSFTFDEFVVGESNKLAYSACKAVSNGENLNSGNMIFLHACSGLGKSHLMQAAGHRLFEREPAKSLCYITANEFTSQMIRAIRENSMDKFKEHYHKNCDVLLLEHVHNLARRERTQTELANILDPMMEQGKMVIFTGNQFPREIQGINDILGSRLGNALITSINPPGFRTRKRIIERKAKGQGVYLDGEVIELLAQNITGDIRKIESAVVGLIAKSSFLKRPINQELAKEVLHEIVGEPSELTITVIKDLICKHFKLTASDIRSKSRKRSIAWPRQVGMYLSRKYTDESLESIGREFNRDHATVQHAVKKIKNEIKSQGKNSQQLKYLIDQIEKQQWK